MKRIFSQLWRCVCLLIIVSMVWWVAVGEGPVTAAPKAKKLLVVTVTKGFRHSSIPTVERILQQLGEQSRSYTVDYARTDEELAAKTTAQALASYDGVVFASTTGELPLADRDAFLNWIKAGHAFVGIHAAADTFHKFPPFIEMIGGEFKTHGPQSTVQCLIEDAAHPATKSLGKSFSVHDEIYQFKNFNQANVRTLLALDKHPNTSEPGYYPIAWGRMYGKGRVFYTALGHREDVLQAEWYGRHLLGGMQWALGEAKGRAKPQKPDSSRMVSSR